MSWDVLFFCFFFLILFVVVLLFAPVVCCLFSLSISFVNNKVTQVWNDNSNYRISHFWENCPWVRIKADKSFLFISDLNVGQYMSILIEEVKNDGRVVRLTQNPQALAKAVATIQHGWTLDAILPGLLIRGRVKRVSRDPAGP